MVGKYPNKEFQKFASWLEDVQPNLNELNSVSIHIDQVFEKKLMPEKGLEVALEIFKEAHALLYEQLINKIIMLVVPLKTSPVLQQKPVCWQTIYLELSKTPPSIYIMKASALLQRDKRVQFVSFIESPFQDKLINSTYNCWRLVDDPSDEDWSRDVRITSAKFIVDKGNYSSINN